MDSPAVSCEDSGKTTLVSKLIASGSNSQMATACSKGTAHLALNYLGQCISTHQGGMNLLISKAETLETLKDKLRSEPVKAAVSELLEVLHAIKGSTGNVITAYNDVKKIFRKEEARKTPGQKR